MVGGDGGAVNTARRERPRTRVPHPPCRPCRPSQCCSTATLLLFAMARRLHTLDTLDTLQPALQSSFLCFIDGKGKGHYRQSILACNRATTGAGETLGKPFKLSAVVPCAAQSPSRCRVRRTKEAEFQLQAAPHRRGDDRSRLT